MGTGGVREDKGPWSVIRVGYEPDNYWTNYDLAYAYCGELNYRLGPLPKGEQWQVIRSQYPKSESR